MRLVVGIVLGGSALVACSSVDDGAADAANRTPSDVPILADASDSDGGESKGTSRDASGAEISSSPLSGSPLCNVFAAGTPCVPDVPARLSAVCSVPGVTDAGASRDAAPQTKDAEITMDASPVPYDADVDGGAGETVACRVDALGDGTFGPTCRVAGPGRDGAECMTGSDCAAGFDCVGRPGRCRAYCCNYACGAHAFCDVEPLAAPPLVNVPVCSPVEACRLLADGTCPSGKTCAVVDKDGTTSCVTVGPSRAGQDCERAHCGDGHTCLGQPGSRQCFKLCHVNVPDDCPSDQRCKGSIQLFSDPSIGICE